MHLYHLNELYQLWNEFKAYLENQPSLLELGQLFGFNYHLQEKFNQLSQLFIQEKKYQESIEFHQDFMNYFKDDKYLCPFYKNLALSYFYQDNNQGTIKKVIFREQLRQIRTLFLDLALIFYQPV